MVSRIVFALLLSLAALPSFAQKFPFSGIWAGELDIHFMEKDSSIHVFMRMEIIPLHADTCVFRIIYAKEKEVKNADVRNYLVYPQAKKNHYTIDETNSILLDARLVDSTLSSVYEVENNVIHTSYRFHGNELTFELLAYNAVPASQSGGDGKVPVVKNYRITNRQKGVLRRVK